MAASNTILHFATGLPQGTGPWLYVSMTAFGLFCSMLFSRSGQPIAGYPLDRIQPATLENSNVSPGLVTASLTYTGTKVMETSKRITAEEPVSDIASATAEILGLAPELGPFVLAVSAFLTVIVVMALSLRFTRESSQYSVRVIYKPVSALLRDDDGNSYPQDRRGRLLFKDWNDNILTERPALSIYYWRMRYLLAALAGLVGLAASFL